MPIDKSFDERTADALSSISQRLTRRGWITSAGMWALRLTGLSLAGVVLPVDRAFAQYSCNGDWQTCGMHGYWCKSCCGHGPRYSQCPNCTSQGSFWSACCTDNCNGWLIRYYDCCATSGVASDCTGDPCGLSGGCPSTWPAYCSGGLEFRCTIVFNTNQTCSPPQSRC